MLVATSVHICALYLLVSYGTGRFETAVLLGGTASQQVLLRDAGALPGRQMIWGCLSSDAISCSVSLVK